MSREKKTKAALWREYGLERLSKPRYSSNERKSIFWVYTSRFCRIRDWRKYGTCISCGAVIAHWSDGDGGHYAPAQGCGVGLLFDAFNVNLECRRCNGFDEGHIIGYRRGLIERYGIKVVVDIENRYLYHQRNPGAEKEYTQDTYHTMIMELRALMLEQGMVE